jgi:hypothetical protein
MALGCFLVANGAFELGRDFGWNLIHAVIGAGVLLALFQNLLFRLAAGLKIAIHANISASKHLCHTLSFLPQLKVEMGRTIQSMIPHEPALPVAL